MDFFPVLFSKDIPLDSVPPEDRGFGSLRQLTDHFLKFPVCLPGSGDMKNVYLIQIYVAVGIFCFTEPG